MRGNMKVGSEKYSGKGQKLLFHTKNIQNLSLEKFLDTSLVGDLGSLDYVKL